MSKILNAKRLQENPFIHMYAKIKLKIDTKRTKYFGVLIQPIGNKLRVAHFTHLQANFLIFNDFWKSLLKFAGYYTIHFWRAWSAPFHKITLLHLQANSFKKNSQNIINIAFFFICMYVFRFLFPLAITNFTIQFNRSDIPK